MARFEGPDIGAVGICAAPRWSAMHSEQRTTARISGGDSGSPVFSQVPSYNPDVYNEGIVSYKRSARDQWGVNRIAGCGFSPIANIQYDFGPGNGIDVVAY